MSSIPDRRAPDTGSLIDNSLSPAMQRYLIHSIFVVIIFVAATLIQIGTLEKIPTAFNFQGMPIQATPTANIGGALIAAPAGSTELVRQTDIHTNIPTRPRTDIITYTVQSGDSISGIAAKFNLTIETIVFSNPILDDDVHSFLPVGTIGVMATWSCSITVMVGRRSTLTSRSGTCRAVKA